MRSEGLTPRYEHGITRNKNGDIFVFGGAQQDGNLNTVQVLRKGLLGFMQLNVEMPLTSFSVLCKTCKLP